MEIEIWKDIPGWEGFYQCSNLGRVKSLVRDVINKKYKTTERILSPGMCTYGYHQVGLQALGRRKHSGVHLLVASSFLNYKKEPGMVVDHINNNKLDNRPENLQVISIRLNTIKSLHTYGKYSSQYVGVTWDKQKLKWKSQMQHGGKHISIGLHNTQEEALEAYKKEIKKLLSEEEILKFENYSDICKPTT